MTLNFFNPEQLTPRGIPVLSVNINGSAIFNRAACVEFPFIQKGARVAFCYDPVRGDIYLINRLENGIVLNRYTKNTSNTLVQFHSRLFRKQMERWTELTTLKPIRFKIATEPTEFNGNIYHALILLNSKS